MTDTSPSPCAAWPSPARRVRRRPGSEARATSRRRAPCSRCSRPSAAAESSSTARLRAAASRARPGTAERDRRSRSTRRRRPPAPTTRSGSRVTSRPRSPAAPRRCGPRASARPARRAPRSARQARGRSRARVVRLERLAGLRAASPHTAPRTDRVAGSTVSDRLEVAGEVPVQVAPLERQLVQRH